MSKQRVTNKQAGKQAEKYIASINIDKIIWSDEMVEWKSVIW